MKFERTRIFNWEGALRGMRNPMESWDKADSEYFRINDGGDLECTLPESRWDIVKIGPKDLKRAQTLIKAGTDHRKFMRQIFVCVDITAPLYWWKEFDTYKVGTVANSTSTMHKLASTPITIDCFEMGDFVRELNVHNHRFSKDRIIEEYWGDIITVLETLRQMYNETKDNRYWKELIRLLPESWLQTRTVTMSYENLVSIAHSDRKNHKLTEWRESFFDWMKSLPYAEELIFLDLSKPDIYKIRSEEAVKRIEDILDLVDKGLSDDFCLAEELESIRLSLLGGKENVCVTKNK